MCHPAIIQAAAASGATAGTAAAAATGAANLQMLMSSMATLMEFSAARTASKAEIVAAAQQFAAQQAQLRERSRQVSLAHEAEVDNIVMQTMANTAESETIMAARGVAGVTAEEVNADWMQQESAVVGLEQTQHSMEQADLLARDFTNRFGMQQRQQQAQEAAPGLGDLALSLGANYMMAYNTTGAFPGESLESYSERILS